MMTNPRKVRTWHTRINDRARGRKFYRVAFELPQHTRVSRKTFPTATEAQEYALKVILRWMRLYDAALVNHSASPAATEKAQVVTE